MKKDYFLGLDMGTGSLGWAVTNDSYEVQRAHGKSLWGVRLFESAKTAEERRGFRTRRRRLHRRNWRLQILQEIFAEEITKVDPGFYLRMKESRYVPGDKRDKSGNCPALPYSLFVDKDYTDKDYHKEFPTIYHLRKRLMETSDTPDIRLVYLALHHIMKHRGHFLLSGDISNIKDFKTTFEQFIKNVKDEELDFHLDILDKEDVVKFIENILKNKQLTKTDKKKQLLQEFKKIKGEKLTKCEESMFNLLIGQKVKLSDLFLNPEFDSCEKSKISFSDNSYDDSIGEIESYLGEQYYIIESAKAVYDWSVLVDILKDSYSISEAKVKVYEKHQKDLAYLKQLVKTHLTKEDYKHIFVDTNEKVYNYCAYIGMTRVNGKKVDVHRDSKFCRGEFISFLKKNVIEKIANSEITHKLSLELDKDTFLPKQVSKENSVLPYQIHLYELKQMLTNLEDRIPLLKEYHEKIIQLFKFRIPYYVGPLNIVKNEKDSPFTWAVRKGNEKVYPWNFDEVIDVEKSAERFIRRMTNKCTYLSGEDVLPKDSLLYSKFMILNELNNLRINGEKISVELKQRIFEKLFCKYRKVTQKKLKDYLIREGIAKKEDELSGVDGDFKSSYTAYHDFKEKLTGITLSQKDKEDIISNIVLFRDDKKLLRNRLIKMFPNLTEGQLKSLCALSYKGWGRLSSKFLEGMIAVSPHTGELWNIITALWETNDNLMQLLSQEYSYQEEIEKNNHQENIELSYQTVEDLYVSPAVKRQIWQTLLVVKEIKKVMGHAPKRVFLEVAREKQESKRTESRKKKLLDLYKACKKEEKEWIDELENRQDHQLRSDKLYLYYVQQGRCMYSGEVISLEELWNNNKYDIDHIYPQSKVIDDSLDNRVLVKREMNANKDDHYPIHEDIRKKMQPFWKMLQEKGFISKRKYERLIRAEKFEPNELAGFIERQIVETRQSTKAVAQILKYALPESEIVYVKAKTVSHFRQDFNFIKVREMNDFHHAKDAYLNIVVGNTYYVKFTKNASWFIKENPGRTYNLKKMFQSESVVRNGEVAWEVENKDNKKATICTVRKFMDKNDILITRRSYEVKGGLFDRNIMKKGTGQIPIKGNDDRLAGPDGIKKYGGYNKVAGSYFMLVESEGKKGKKMRTIEFVPLYLKSEIEKSEYMILQYLQGPCNLKNPNILLRRIKKETLFEINGFKMWVTGRGDKRLLFKGANQLLLPPVETKTLKQVMKFISRKKENKDIKCSERDGMTEDSLIALYDAFLHKLQHTMYKFFLSNEEKVLLENRDVFINLIMEDKCVVLSEILHLFQCQSATANLKLIKGSGTAGKLRVNKNILLCDSLKIINQSPTGIYEQEIDLLKI